ncbi:MAG: glycine cleavage system protein GcvH [Acidobacteriota bacterium]
MYPSDYRYTKEHEWLKIEGDVYILGITSFAQSELGEVVFVDLPEVGSSFDAGDEIGSIESVKAVAEFYAPIAGEIVEVNEALEDSPEMLNDDPHEGGWICKLSFDAEDEGLGDLMDAEAYSDLAQTDD